MVQINGKYEIVESVNFDKLLAKGGVPEDKAKIANEIKTVLEVTLDGNKVKFQTDANFGNQLTVLVLDGETEEKLPIGGTIKSVSTLNGNVLTINSTKPDGTTGGSRKYTFSDSGLEVVYNSGDITAKRVYKRI